MVSTQPQIGLLVLNFARRMCAYNTVYIDILVWLAGLEMYCDVIQWHVWHRL